MVMPKKRYDITFTVAMSDKAIKQIFDEQDFADEEGEHGPLGSAGLDMTATLEDVYGVKAKLKAWTFKRMRPT
jgi:hypothetical protein